MQRWELSSVLVCHYTSFVYVGPLVYTQPHDGCICF